MLSLIRTNSDNPDFKLLTDLLDDELCRLYNTNKADFEEYNRISNLHTIVIAYENGAAAGGGCFRQADENTVELKRMYVQEASRGRGVASAIVAELEKWAMELGFTQVKLETGKQQPEAVALYSKLGYHLITMHANEEDFNVCMQKKLK